MKKVGANSFHHLHYRLFFVRYAPFILDSGDTIHHCQERKILSKVIQLSLRDSSP